ncbi:hypothetical protein M758_11G082000 [Ceratodon purpureus]|nr:hypothetical protein M758_11G082000 [Ceratodon purpureus]
MQHSVLLSFIVHSVKEDERLLVFADYRSPTLRIINPRNHKFGFTQEWIFMVSSKFLA